MGEVQGNRFSGVNRKYISFVIIYLQIINAVKIFELMREGQAIFRFE